MSQYSFQFCQKIVLFKDDDSKVLLCKRNGENDLDGYFSFPGGKMETTDKFPIDGIKREKNEELGTDLQIDVCPKFSTNLVYDKKDGNRMILSYYYAKYISGEINLNEEYSEYRWVDINEVETFEPKTDAIWYVINLFLRIKNEMGEGDMERI